MFGEGQGEGKAITDEPIIADARTKTTEDADTGAGDVTKTAEEIEAEKLEADRLAEKSSRTEDEFNAEKSEADKLAEANKGKTPEQIAEEQKQKIQEDVEAKAHKDALDKLLKKIRRNH